MVTTQGASSQSARSPGVSGATAQPELSPPPVSRPSNSIARVRIASSSLVALAAILSIPAIFVLVTRGDWLLDIGGEDNWIYIKYFSVWGSPHPELRQYMDQHYKATR